MDQVSTQILGESDISSFVVITRHPESEGRRENVYNANEQERDKEDHLDMIGR